MKEPLVIDPPGFSSAAAWKECSDYVDQCGGLTHEDGEPNWRAAFGADPGVTSCPICGESYWAWGRVQRCCDFNYETDWWPMYSYGVQANRLMGSPREHERRMKSPFYAYGYSHPVADPWKTHDTLPWREIVAEFLENGGFRDERPIRMWLSRKWNAVAWFFRRKRYRSEQQLERLASWLKCFVHGHEWQDHPVGGAAYCQRCYAWREQQP